MIILPSLDITKDFLEPTVYVDEESILQDVSTTVVVIIALQCMMEIIEKVKGD